jgi:hypothetical protein
MGFGIDAIKMIRALSIAKVFAIRTISGKIKLAGFSAAGKAGGTRVSFGRFRRFPVGCCMASSGWNGFRVPAVGRSLAGSRQGGEGESRRFG